MGIRSLFLNTMIIVFLFDLVACSLPRSEPEFPLKHYGVLTEEQITTSLKAQDKPYRILSISGGGPNGAWTAGVINSWQEDRFDCIIGVSTGALAGTSIYLDRKDDLKAAYTDVDNSDIYKFINVFDIFTVTSLSSNDAFEDTVAKYITDDLIDQVAAEYKKTNRLLLVCAFDLDSGRIVTWNLGQLALNKDYATYRDAILASAAIPILFPPIEIGSHLFVDGGARANVYIHQPILKLAAADHKKVVVRLLLNTMPSELGESRVDKSFAGVATKSVSSLIDSAMIGSIFSIQTLCKYYEFDFAYGQPTPGTPLEGYDFSREKMLNIYNYGLKWGKNPEWNSVFEPRY